MVVSYCYLFFTLFLWWICSQSSSLVLLFCTGRDVLEPFFPWVTGTVSPAGHRPALPGLLAAHWVVSQAAKSLGQVYREYSPCRCVSGVSLFYLYAWVVVETGFLIRNFEYVCLLSVNFQCPIGKSVVIFCNLLVLFLPARSPSESSLSPLRPETHGVLWWVSACMVLGA